MSGSNDKALMKQAAAQLRQQAQDLADLTEKVGGLKKKAAIADRLTAAREIVEMQVERGFISTPEDALSKLAELVESDSDLAVVKEAARMSHSQQLDSVRVGDATTPQGNSPEAKFFEFLMN